jgi:hypothetical protein
MRYGDSGSSNGSTPAGNAAAVTDADADTASADLPAFLTDDQHPHALNGAAD